MRNHRNGSSRLDATADLIVSLHLEKWVREFVFGVVVVTLG